MEQEPRPDPHLFDQQQYNVSLDVTMILSEGGEEASPTYRCYFSPGIDQWTRSFDLARAI
jgi:hypothetical protein